MSTNPTAWNIEAYLGSTPITLPAPRELYEMALVRMKAGEVITIGGRRYRAINKDVTSALAIADRRYRVNFASVASSSTEDASPTPDIPEPDSNKDSSQEEPLAVIKVNDELIKFYWSNKQTFATAFMAAGDILRYKPTSGVYKIVSVEYDSFEDDDFWITQFCEELK
ncbi:hypothetical protein [Pseudomonas uvaldensis]|uniref:hypothetical protein n=1 Tax=Pseudomonas uvaldensis TaxID=2878385 RepID=UPI001E4B07ED|nr:hypothetical protein [Pseudomonas uvaldensis]MCE0463895.1 hypothetical protein [Pseudomonas uvaldensis]